MCGGRPMSPTRTLAFLLSLVNELRKLPAETAWLEFKVNNDKFEEIGEYISALSNAAALHGKANAYLIWGIQDGTHEIVGTTFKPRQAKQGNEELENWLLRQLNPHPHFSFHELEMDGHAVVLLEIPRAEAKPVQFCGKEWIRVGTYRKNLKDFPELERELWRIFDDTPFEARKAMEHVDGQGVLDVLDYSRYFELLSLPLPTTHDKILERMAQDEIIVKDEAGAWDITNLGAVLFAKKLDSFKGLKRKAVRVIVYDGKGRLKTLREQVGQMGYAAGFERLLAFIDALLPRNEVVARALRKEASMYPELALRELLVNMLIHQDFSQTGSGPMVEIFSNRIEITNPGLPLISTERFLDNAPTSRNEALASLLRRCGFCEERGSGVDKVVGQTELYQLPAPLFETPGEFTRAVLFAPKPLKEMDRADRVRACYLHACLRYVERSHMTNSSLRIRFGIEERNTSVVSRIIREAVEDGKVKAFDPEQGKKYAKYLPIWA